MQNIIGLLNQKAASAIQSAFVDQLPKGSDLLNPEVVQSTQSQFGHYQCNNALKIAKELKQNPRQVAEKILAHLDLKAKEGKPMIAKTEIAGPGFINIILEPTFISMSAISAPP